MANGSSASGGKYTTAHLAGKVLFVGETHWFQVDRALYLPTTAVQNSQVYGPAPLSWQHFKALSTAPTTPLPDAGLASLVLLGGDATDDNIINGSDAGCIGGAYGLAPGACYIGGNSSSDVNGDGAVDIFDLTLMGNNWFKTSSPWTIP